MYQIDEIFIILPLISLYNNKKYAYTTIYTIKICEII